MKIVSLSYSFLPVLVSLLQTSLSSTVFVRAQETGDHCNITKAQQKPLIHKPTYTIVVHAVRGLEQTAHEASSLFSSYLTATAGQKFDPPIQFNMVPLYYLDLLEAIVNDEMDFLYSNPGVYSCIGTQVGATALATVVKSAFVRGRTFDLDVYGGVIAVRHDNDEIHTLADIKGKIIGAGAVVDLMGGQMQIYEMERAGLSYVNDPKQVVFTSNQYDVVMGVLDGTFDVGFIRTGQIESTVDETGRVIDPQLFKILEPKTFIMESGELFPFLHSTDIHPQWPLAALPQVPADVQRAVQAALMEFGSYVLIGQLQECSQSGNESKWCDEIERKSTSLRTPCNTTDDLVELVGEISRTSNIAGFRTARSYFELRSIQERTGFLVENEEGWQCIAPDDLYEGITCPQGYFKRNMAEYDDGCTHVGLSCDSDHDCFCKPCVKAFEVDVYYLAAGEADPHLHESFADSYPGCEKMEICSIIKQRESVTMRIFDNMLRDGAQVGAKSGDGEKGHKNIIVKNIPGTYAYEFTLTDNKVQVHVIDVFVDGESISQSPIRVMVVEADCVAQYGEEGNRVPDSEGICICADNTYEVAGTCLGSTPFILIILSGVLLVIGIVLFFYLGYKKSQSDSVWHINVEELHFNEPPEIIGAGGFGVVILGQYRGTKVAVKRVIPRSNLSKGNSGSLNSEQSDGTGSAEIVEDNSNSVVGEKTMVKISRGVKARVNFGTTANSDVESQQTVSHSGSMALGEYSFSSSNKDWDRLMTIHDSDVDVLRLLESATSSDHGSGTLREGAASNSVVLMKFLPMWLRFDTHSVRVSAFVNEMRMLSRLRHPCITTVMGAVVSSAIDPMLVMEYMEYGSLHDLLHNETMTPGGEIILQVVRDIVQGIQFLHASKPLILHGDLKAKNILVDSRFRAKVADFGFSHFKCSKQRNVLRGTPFYMAPEYLRRRSEYTTACDIYSLAMIIYEIYARAGPFEGEDPRKMLPKICHPRLNKRPPIPDSCPPKMVDLMKKCWSANAFFRPSAKDIDYVLVEMSSIDTEPLETAKGRLCDNLKRKPTSLYDVFPKHIADALNAGKKVEAESHEIVTVLFSDIVGFTTISQQFTPLKVSDLLDRLYQAFDELAHKHGVFKVQTIGDAYMGVTNLDGSKYDTHVKQIAEYAQEAIDVASQILIDKDDPALGTVQIRVGFHSGPVVSSVIGSLNPRYGLFGDTVNTASSMESNSMPGRIHCSSASAQLLQNQAPGIPLTLRGMSKINGKGKMKTYWVGGDNLVHTHKCSLMELQVDPNSERRNGDMTSDEMQRDRLDNEKMTLHLATDHVPQKVLLDAGRDHFIPCSVRTQHETCPIAIRMDGTIEHV